MTAPNNWIRLFNFSGYVVERLKTPASLTVANGNKLKGIDLDEIPTSYLIACGGTCDLISQVRDDIRNDGVEMILLERLEFIIKRAKPTKQSAPRWVVVRDLVGVGSTTATEICRYYGLDPDEELVNPDWPEESEDI